PARSPPLADSPGADAFPVLWLHSRVRGPERGRSHLHGPGNGAVVALRSVCDTVLALRLSRSDLGRGTAAPGCLDGARVRRRGRARPGGRSGRPWLDPLVLRREAPLARLLPRHGGRDRVQPFDELPRVSSRRRPAGGGDEALPAAEPPESLQALKPEVIHTGSMRALVIVPAWNEERDLPAVLAELRRVAPEWDVCVVDDGSSDRTAAVAREGGARVLRLPMNLGIGGAVQTGYLWARERGYEIAAQIDGDGQHDPQYLEAALGPIRAGTADLVIGSRY